jgi:hypothetical protein
MKSLVCLAGAALSAQLAVTTSSHAASMPWIDTETSIRSAEANDPSLILVAGPRGGGGGNRQNFNANNFHNNVSSNRNSNVNVNRNATVNRNTNVNVNRNANVNVNRYGGGYNGGCCSHYDSGPGWGGVAAGVAVGAVVGAAAASATAPPPPYYPPGTVYVPAY